MKPTARLRALGLWTGPDRLDDPTALIHELIDHVERLSGSLREYLNAGHKEARRKAATRAKDVLAMGITR